MNSSLIDYVKNFINESYNSPNDFTFKGKSINSGSRYAYAFIYNKRLKKCIFSDARGSHGEMIEKYLWDDPEFAESFDLQEVESIFDLRNPYDKNFAKSHPVTAKYIMTGRVWIYPKTKKQEQKLFVAWWDEMTSKEFNENCTHLVKCVNVQFNTKFAHFYALDNNGQILQMTLNDDVKIDKRSSEYDKESNAIWKDHEKTSPEARKHKRDNTAEFRKNRDQYNQEKYYNHTKSKTEAEWRANRYVGDSLQEYVEIISEAEFDERYPHVYLMIGIPGSGKSTWCKKNHPDLPIVSRDKIRAQLGFAETSQEKTLLSKSDERKVTKIEDDLIMQYCEQAWKKKIDGFIIDDTNLGKYRTSLINKLHQMSMHVIGVNIDTPLDVCIERRKGQIPKNVMQQMYDSKRDLKEDEVDEIINVKYKND